MWITRVDLAIAGHVRGVAAGVVGQRLATGLAFLLVVLFAGHWPAPVVFQAGARSVVTRLR